ncbi:MAG TPA: hypothetical protein PKA41_15560, partial [Verrucomicrobiota bacterium]|nr:hypothetical protein [Verrucomicrobiota bacterium]
PAPEQNDEHDDDDDVGFLSGKECGECVHWLASCGLTGADELRDSKRASSLATVTLRATTSLSVHACNAMQTATAALAMMAETFIV